MTIRMTLTAAALASVALAGCSSMGGDKTMTAPMVKTPAPVVTAPSVAVTAPSVAVGTPGMMAPAANVTTRPGMTAPSATMTAPGATTLGDPLLQEQGTQTMKSRTGFGAPALVKNPEGMKDGDPFLQDQSTATLDSQYSDVDTMRMRDPLVPTTSYDPLLQDQRSPEVTDTDSMMNDVMVMEEDMPDTMMSVDETVSADDAVMNACFQAGGQVVAWVGDSTGETQACRREDGLEYRLADAQYYQ